MSATAEAGPGLWARTNKMSSTKPFISISLFLVQATLMIVVVYETTVYGRFFHAQVNLGLN